MPEIKRSGQRMALILGLALLGLGLLVGLGSWHAYRSMADIKAHGVHVEGHVVNKSHTTESTQKRVGNETSENYEVRYWFPSPTGERIEATGGVSKQLFDTLTEGGPILVGYPPGDPRKNFPLDGGEASASTTLFMMAMALLFMFIGGFLLRIAVRPAIPTQ